MDWLFYCLVQTVTLVAWLLAAAFVPYPLVSIILLIGACVYLWRSVSHPDHFFRRAMWACLSAALGQFVLVEIAKIFPPESLPAFVAVLVAFIDQFFRGSFVAGAFLIGSALLFGVLEILRLRVDHRGSSPFARPWLEVTSAETKIANKPGKKDRLVTTDLVATVFNNTKSTVLLHSPSMTALGLLPRKASKCWWQIKHDSGPKRDAGARITLASGQRQELHFRSEWKEGPIGNSLRNIFSRMGWKPRRRVSLKSSNGSENGGAIVFGDILSE